jgi:hypothetical protein
MEFTPVPGGKCSRLYIIQAPKEGVRKMDTDGAVSIRDLTAPEAHVLLQGPPGRLNNGNEPFKMAVLELVLRGWLDVRETLGELRSQPEVRFIRGKRADVPEHRPLFAAFRIFDAGFAGGWAPDDGLPGFVLWRDLAKRYGGSKGYARLEVLPSLRARGLFERDSGLIGTLLRGGWRRTLAGNRLREQLLRTLSEAQGPPPERAQENRARVLNAPDTVVATILTQPVPHEDVAGLAAANAGSSNLSKGLGPETFELISAVSGALERASKSYPGGWRGDGTGSGGLRVLGGEGFGGGGDGGSAGG